MAVTDVTLHGIAKDLGIANHETMNRDALIKSIKGQIGIKPFLSKTLVIISIIAGLAVVGSMIASAITVATAISSLAFTMSETSKIERKLAALEWQKVIVYSIIEKGQLANKGHGMKFDDIKKEYQKMVGDQITIYKEYDVTKGDLDDTTLQRIMQELLRSGTVFQHPGKMYTIRLDVNNAQSIDRQINETEIRYEIINLLTTERGKHTAEELRTLIDQKFGTTRTEAYFYTINRLVAEHMIVRTYDKADKSRIVLWTSSNCPTCMTLTPTITPEPPGDAFAPLQGDQKKVLCCGQIEGSDSE